MNARGPVSLFFLTALVGVAHGQIAFHPAVNLPVGAAPEGGALVDFDDTGKLGLVVASENPDKLEFFANKGNGTFDAAFAVLTGNDTSPEGVAPGDFDDECQRAQNGLDHLTHSPLYRNALRYYAVPADAIRFAVEKRRVHSPTQR